MPAPSPAPPNTAERDRLRALARFSAGSNGEYGLPTDLIPVIQRGQGCRVWDTAGRAYLDMTMAWGAALVGHAHPRVIEAACRQAPDGANFAALNRRALELAERLASIRPDLQRIRLVASGTEATLLALRIARTYTGRPKVLKFDGAYHGQHPVGVASMVGSAPLPAADATGTGAPWVERDVLVAPFNDLATTDRILADHADTLAAVIVEPLHRCLPPEPGFLPGLRQATSRRGIVLVFDEVVTGFRLALGGAAEYFGVTPDLTAFGKALGGGFPIGACGGRADLMDVVDEHRYGQPDYTWSASTAGGNPVSSAAALATLEVLSEPGVYPHLHTLGNRLRETLRTALAHAGRPVQVLGAGPLAQFAFSAQPVRNQQDWLASDRAAARRILCELVRRGVFLNPMGTKLYLSLAHDEAALGELGERLVEALAVLAPQ